MKTDVKGKINERIEVVSRAVYYPTNNYKQVNLTKRVTAETHLK